MTDRRVEFLADFDYSPTPMVTIAYKAGMIKFVRGECADKAVAAGKARAVSIGGPASGLAATLARLKVRPA